MNLDTSNWKEFQISNLFDVFTGGDLIMSTLEDGDIPIASNSCENNNIASYTSFIEGRQLFDHKKTISIADRGCFKAFIQPKDFYIATRVKALVCKDFLNINILHLAFIVSVINLESFKFSYGRNCCANLPYIKIRLPIVEKQGKPLIDTEKKYCSEGFVPDWDWMETYIKSLHYKVLSTKNELKTDTFSCDEWEYFTISDLFDVQLSNGDIKLDDVESGNVPLVSAGEENNGIIGYISEDGDGIANKFTGGQITVDMFCNAFYQDKDFYSVSHGRVNILKPRFVMSKEIGIFITTLINNEKYKYSYGRGLYSGEASSMKIKLPIKKDDSGMPVIDDVNKFNLKNHVPDWNMMHDLVSNLPFGDRL